MNNRKCPTGKQNAIILLAAYNGGSYLSAQLDSLLQQRDAQVEIYIRDDGSTDNTLEIIEDYSSKFSNVNNVTGGNPSGSAARNFLYLLNTVSFDPDDVVFFCDQDDIWMPDKVNRACTKIRSGVDLYSGALKTFSEGQYHGRIIKNSFTPTKFDHLFQGLSAGCTYAISYKLIQVIKRIVNDDAWFVENDFSHDWLVYTLARVHKFQIFHDAVPQILYRQHSNNVQGSLAGIKGLIYRLRHISSPWFIGQILKNEEFLEINSEAKQLIEAVRDKKYFYLLLRILQMRRSKIQSLVLYGFIMMRRSDV